MERVVHISTDYKAAEEWDIRQQIAMSPRQRMRAASVLKRRSNPPASKDVRECHGKS